MSKHDNPTPEISGDAIADKYAESLIKFLEQGRGLSPATKERLLKALSGQSHSETSRAISSLVMERSAVVQPQRTMPPQRGETETGSSVEQTILNNLDKADRQSNRSPQKFAEFFRNLLPSGYEVGLIKVPRSRAGEVLTARGELSFRSKAPRY
ncbi:MAG: hypothetical protein AAB410_02475 [Patescibacteria group bacterium]